MICKLAYLTSPSPNRFLLHIQLEDAVSTAVQFEISEAHLANIIIDGASFALRKTHRVPVPQRESAEG